MNTILVEYSSRKYVYDISLLDSSPFAEYCECRCRKIDGPRGQTSGPPRGKECRGEAGEEEEKKENGHHRVLITSKLLIPY